MSRRILQLIIMVLIQAALVTPAVAGEKEFCAFDQRHDYLMQTDPAYRARALEAERKIQAALHGRKVLSEEIYTIPVVVHVIHQGEAVGQGTNISDAQIQSAITALNQDYRRIIDTPGYKDDNTDIGVEFRLAYRDPNNQPSTGIVRIDNSADSYYRTWGVVSSNNDSNNEITIKNLSRWPHTDYYNIWIVNRIDGSNDSGTQGFAYSSAASATLDGAIILYNAFGTTGNLKSFSNMNRTATHELGHAFDLLHTFEGNSCTESNCATEGDKICDTPPTLDVVNPLCNDGSCGGNRQVENYMDYTPEDCKYKFTPDQRERIRTAISVNRSTLLTSLGCVPVTIPVSNFSAPTPTCSGAVTFTDLTSDGPTSWNWSFPGGLPASSTASKPTVTYSPGFYDVSLSTANSIGAGNTETKTDYLKVFSPAPSACSMTTQNLDHYKYYINNFSFNTINKSSGDTVADNVSPDFTCSEISILTPGDPYAVSVTTGGNDTTVRVYIDYNNDGDLSQGEEMAFASDNNGPGHNGTINTPLTVVSDTILRLRTTSDIYCNDSIYSCNTIAPCSPLKYGQAEDYGVVFMPDASPVSDFKTDTPTACPGSINFQDQSANGSSSWAWSFPGGTPDASTVQSPTVSYSNPGMYDVSLTAGNSKGTGAIATKTAYLGIFSPPPSTCSMTTENTGYYPYYISNFSFNTINKSSGNTVADNGSPDFTCSELSRLTPGEAYSLSITTGGNGTTVRVYIDYNNDGDLSQSEEMAFASDNNGPVHSGTITTPPAVTSDTILRLRATSDLYCNDSHYICNTIAPCSPLAYGQAEDYGLVFIPQAAPVSDFTSDRQVIAANDSITFKNQSANGSSAWNWSFPGGIPAQSTAQNPTVAYKTPGFYTVSLTASNSIGTGNKAIKESYIIVSDPPAAACAVSTTDLTSNSGIGIFELAINDSTINSTSSAVNDHGSLDFTGSVKAIELAGDTGYSVAVTVGPVNPEYFNVYIDYNNNGDFSDSGETIFTATAQSTDKNTFTFTTPAAPLTNTLLRMRVISDFNALGPCGALAGGSLSYGQAEDYAVIFPSRPPTSMPNGDLNSDGVINLKDAILALKILVGLSPDEISCR